MPAGLSLTQLNDLRQAMLPLVKKGFIDTQKLRTYTGQKQFMKASKVVPLGLDGKRAWKWRTKSGPGPVPNAPFKSTNANYDESLAEASLNYKQHVDKNFVYDTIQLLANAASPERILNLLDNQRSYQREGIANWLEAMIMTNNPQNATDLESYDSLRVIFRRSMTSGGVFVSDPVGGFNGVYHTWGDGTTNALYANVDMSLVANERFRPYVVTHDGVVNQSWCDRIKRAQEECSWDPLLDLQGEFEVADMFKIFMDPEFSQDYENFVSAGPDDRNGDAYPFKKYTINGATKVSVPQLRQDAHRPVYGVDMGNVRLERIRGCWDNFAQTTGSGTKAKLTAEAMNFPGSHTSFYEPTDFYGNMFCENPAHGGFCMHGSF